MLLTRSPIQTAAYHPLAGGYHQSHLHSSYVYPLVASPPRGLLFEPPGVNPYSLISYLNSTPVITLLLSIHCTSLFLTSSPITHLIISPVKVPHWFIPPLIVLYKHPQLLASYHEKHSTLSAIT
uniref:Uncharacterized protein n=1 Tax=Austropuccinia psidii TaxID=181123 RepID=A0A513X036_9BASI|nr:hypothetical protein [Austropuccinia psidii]QDH07297.1 hypothetical protein [Austropuccinia psidii]